MLDFFTSLIDTASALVDFLFNTATALFDFVTHIPVYTVFLIQSVNVMPTVLIPFMIVCISVYIVLFMINRR